MQEKNILENTQEMEQVKVEREDKAVKATEETIRLKSIVEDGNDLVYAEMPDTKQQEHIKRMKRAIRQKTVCYGRIYAIEEVSDQFLLRILVKKDSLKVIIPASDFFALSYMEGIENDSPEEKFIRHRRKASHMLGAAISFIPLQMGENEDGIPFVVASRKAAMEKKQKEFFFSDNAVEVGTVAKASIISVAPRYITVECLGVETVMGTGALSAYTYIEDATDTFENGDGIMVAIEKLNIDAENEKVEVSFSHSLIEKVSVKSERVSENMIKGRYDGTVVGLRGNYYTVILTGPKIRGLIPTESYRGLDTLLRGDKISVLVEGYDERKNQIIGSCMRR